MKLLNCKGRILKIDNPVLMGIINITPDSYYDKSRVKNLDDVLRKAEQMINVGATILDVGGQSTRPGSEQIGVDEELKRVVQPIQKIRKNFPDIFISVDTFYSSVACEAVAEGADMVNDISGGTLDGSMFEAIGKLRVPYILTHIKGTPASMQMQPQYENVVNEISNYFLERINLLQQNNVYDIILDVGFGFGKTVENNFELLQNLSAFKIFDKALLVGISRKSLITKTLNITAEKALNATTCLHTVALQNGANILRVHDVAEAKEVVEMYKRLNEFNFSSR